MLLYESAKNWHGRQFPFEGDFYDNVFIHFTPNEARFEKLWLKMELMENEFQNQFQGVNDFFLHDVEKFELNLIFTHITSEMSGKKTTNLLFKSKICKVDFFKN